MLNNILAVPRDAFKTIRQNLQTLTVLRAKPKYMFIKSIESKSYHAVRTQFEKYLEICNILSDFELSEPMQLLRIENINRLGFQL